MKFLLIFTLLFFTNCKIIPRVGKDYKKPEIAIIENWRGAKLNNAQTKEINWWKNFNDENLEKLITILLERNYSLKIAQSRIIEARANVTIKNSALLPSVSASGYASRGDNYFNPINQNNRPIVNLFNAGFDVNWELDLFGANYRAKEAAKALWQASENEKNYLIVTLIAEFANNYFNFSSVKNQINLQKTINKNYDQLITISKEKQAAGLISEIEFNNFKIKALSSQKELSNLENLQNQYLSNLDFLLGFQPTQSDDLFASDADLPNLKEDFIANLPSKIIANRFDVLKAERELAASVALTGNAFGQIFPKISLTSFFGFFSNSSGSLLKPNSQVFSNQVNFTTPILDFGGVFAGIKTIKEREKQALITYEEAINNALKEVQIAMIDYYKAREELNFLDEIYNSQKLINELNQQRFKEGLIAKFDLINSEISLLQARQNQLKSQTNFLIKTAALYKSLGGGF